MLVVPENVAGKFRDSVRIIGIFFVVIKVRCRINFKTACQFLFGQRMQLVELIFG